MSENPRTYSALSAEEQSAVSVWIESFEQSYEYEGAAALKKAVTAAPEEMRAALLSQLLPSLIDHDRKRKRPTPTLHELRSRFPDLAGVLADAYPLLPANYRLPVELRGYRVLRVVGEGGQAIVLRAQDDVHSAVAIKLSASPEHNELLLRERELLGQCQHPGIPEVIASGVDEDRAFFVMPFLRGMTLADKYATHRPSADEAARIAAELCGVVEHLHYRGILHRDIKPQNVWIDEPGSVKLIDLGMAIDRSSWGSPRAAVSEFHGTPAFMSPEQAASDGENNGELSDVFSIGSVLYWMGTGAPPYGEGSQESVLTRAASGQIERDRLQAIANWPKALTRVCLDAIAAEPSQRVASAAELRERLASQSWAAAKPAARRSRSIVVVATLLVVAVTAVFARPYLPASWSVLSLPQSDTNPVETPSTSTSRERPRWIDEAARMARVDLESITSDQFTVGVHCRARLVEPWGDQPNAAGLSPELAVTLDKSLSPLAPALQYRVGESAWSELFVANEAAGWSAPLSMVAAASRGPVQLRLVGDPAGNPETAAGPFRYELDIARALKEDEQAFGQELLEEAASEKCFDVEQPGWAVREEYARRIGPIVDDFYFGEEQGELTSVTARLDKLTGRKKGGAEGRPGLGLREGFALVSKEVQDAPKLWVAIRFSGGGSLGPVLYEKPRTAEQKEKERVLAWFDQLSKDDRLAQLRHRKFVLTRLNEVLPSLTHLHFVGTRRFVDGDSTHVRESPAGVKEQIEDRPSSEMVVDLSTLAGDRTIEIPPIWSPVKVKGRFPDGAFTPTFEVYNSDTTMCRCSLPAVKASSPTFDRELYVYIEDETSPQRNLSILPLVPNADQLAPTVRDQCLKTRLSLASPLPEEAVSVRYYTDRNFENRVKTAQPGMLYARYLDAQDQTIGYSAYRLSEAFMRVWIKHALEHATPSGERPAPVELLYRQPRQ